jgi:hypothetical protein
MIEKTYTETTYVICHNGSDIIHPSEVRPGTVLATGQTYLEEFTDKNEWKDRLAEMGYDISTLEPTQANTNGNEMFPDGVGVEPPVSFVEQPWIGPEIPDFLTDSVPDVI